MHMHITSCVMGSRQRIRYASSDSTSIIKSMLHKTLSFGTYTISSGALLKAEKNKLRMSLKWICAVKPGDSHTLWQHEKDIIAQNVLNNTAQHTVVEVKTTLACFPIVSQFELLVYCCKELLSYWDCSKVHRILALTATQGCCFLGFFSPQR